MVKQNNVYKQAYNKALRLLENGGNLPSEPELGAGLGVSRTTVRAILSRMQECGLIDWDKRRKLVLRAPVKSDFFPEDETDSLTQIIERSFMRKLLAEGAAAGMQINELELAREIGVGTSSVREFLIRFSRFGLIEKRPNSHWVLKGFTRDFALELTEIREIFELRSAQAFVWLPPASSAWQELDALEAEHRAILADVGQPVSRVFGTRRATAPVDPRRLAQPFHRRLLRRDRDDISLPLPVEQGTGEDTQQDGAEEHLAYIAALKSGDAGARRQGLPRAPQIGARDAVAVDPGRLSGLPGNKRPTGPISNLDPRRVAFRTRSGARQAKSHVQSVRNASELPGDQRCPAGQHDLLAASRSSQPAKKDRLVDRARHRVN
jgi:DNA-binding GntR family transcriptional regulator